MTASNEHDCEHTDLVTAYALQALPPADIAAVEAQISACPACREQLASLQPVVESLASSRMLLRPSPLLAERLARRISEERGTAPAWPTPGESPEPEWDEVAPGIFCHLLATDTDRDRVSMLVRLGPGVAYPPHRHADVEELHLLHGELWIEDQKLHPGDYHRSEPGTSDERVWSETGCMCVLITSSRDVLG